MLVAGGVHCLQKIKHGAMCCGRQTVLFKVKCGDVTLTVSQQAKAHNRTMSPKVRHRRFW